MPLFSKDLIALTKSFISLFVSFISKPISLRRVLSPAFTTQCFSPFTALAEDSRAGLFSSSLANVAYGNDFFNSLTNIRFIEFVIKFAIEFATK